MVLVTGANSLLAVNTIIELLNRGHKVKGLLRNIASFPLAPHPNLVLVKGDINDVESIKRAIKGCTKIIHIAALTDQCIPTYNAYKKVNIEGTKNILKIAIQNNIKRLVYVSTANAIGYGNINNPGNENLGMRHPFTKSHYANSKAEAQEYLLKFANKNSTPEIILVNPTFMLGKYDTKPSSGKIILMGYGKKIVFVPPGGKNFIHAADAAKGTANALENGKHGHAYLLAGENLTYYQFYQKVRQCTGQKQLFISLPKYSLLAIGFIGGILQKTGIKTSVSLNNMRILTINNFYSNKKSVRELGMETAPIEEAITASIVWFKSQKVII